MVQGLPWGCLHAPEQSSELPMHSCWLDGETTLHIEMQREHPP